MYKYLTIVIMAAAIALRVLLCWVNAPANSFDNHYAPIYLILKTGEIPRKDACFQCYQPPMFYCISATVARGLTSLGMQVQAMLKSLQLLNCLYGILTVITVWLILKRFSLSPLSRLVGLSFVCFVPRHIYMSAMHANDCLSYLAVAVSLLLVLITIDRGLWLTGALLTGLALIFAAFVKYTTFAAIPMVALPLAALACFKSELPRSKAAAALAAAVLPPLLLLGSYCAYNVKAYGQPLPWNDNAINTSVVHPRDQGGVSFLSFKPWQYLQEPIVMPGQLHSFWTLIYSGMWADTEPKFTYYTDRSTTWWHAYYAWLRGERGFPQEQVPLSGTTRTIARGLLALGLVPLVMLVMGLAMSLLRLVPQKNAPLSAEAVKLLTLPVLLACNAAVIILLTLRAPVYSSMKASYFLISLPVYAVCIGLAMQWLEQRARLKGAAIAVFAALALLSSAAVLRIVWALQAAIDR